MKNKYNIGDKVFYIENRNVKEDIVTGISVDKDHILYYKFGYGYLDCLWLEEKYIFPSKEELLASL